MTRKECEKKLVDLMEEAYKVFKEYDPTGSHLSMFATDDGHCAMGYKVAWVEPFKFETITIIDGFKSMNGCYMLSE